MNQVSIEYFAVLREHVGRDAETLQTGARTIGELYDELDRRHAFPPVGRLKVARNGEFARWDDPLADGDHVVFIPPVAGG